MVCFIAEITDMVVLITEEDGITAKEFPNKEEASNWESSNLAFSFYVLEAV